MDAQLKRGMLDVCVLASLLREDSYGYRIIKETSGYVELSESTLYPILKRLEGSGCVSVYAVEHNGRLRKYYSITDAAVKKSRPFSQNGTRLCVSILLSKKRPEPSRKASRRYPEASSKEENDA